MADKTYDVIVIGGGFAGVTASREISNRGYDTLLVEAKDRLGGRTWYDERLGREIEMGGTYVHWNQPHVWSELLRYGIELKESPAAEHAYLVMEDGEVLKESDFHMTTKLMESMEVFLGPAKSRGYFERPYDPYFDDTLEKIDHLSIQDHLESIKPQLDKTRYTLLESLWTSYTSTKHLDETGLAHAYRWAALTGHDMPEFQATFEQYSMATGTKSLIEGIFSDSKAELKLSTPIQSISKTEDNDYLVTSRDGEEFKAKAVVVAVPVNVLNKIEFSPAIADAKRDFSTEKQASQGIKVWAKVKGLEGAATFKAPSKYPVNMAITDVISEDGTEGIIMGFGNDSTLDMDDPKEVEKALRVWIPEIEVIESTGHNWTTDEFASGTWGVIKKEQLTKYGQAVREPEEGIFFAGSDFANGWAGYMDGAIETGITAGNGVTKYLVEQENLVPTA